MPKVNREGKIQIPSFLRKQEGVKYGDEAEARSRKLKDSVEIVFKFNKRN